MNSKSVFQIFKILFQIRDINILSFVVSLYRAVEKGGTGGGTSPPSHHFLQQKFFSHFKSENLKFLHVNSMWDFSFFIEQDISDKT